MDPGFASQLAPAALVLAAGHVQAVRVRREEGVRPHSPVLFSSRRRVTSTRARWHAWPSAMSLVRPTIRRWCASSRPSPYSVSCCAASCSLKRCDLRALCSALPRSPAAVVELLVAALRVVSPPPPPQSPRRRRRRRSRPQRGRHCPSSTRSPSAHRALDVVALLGEQEALVTAFSPTPGGRTASRQCGALRAERTAFVRFSERTRCGPKWPVHKRSAAGSAFAESWRCLCCSGWWLAKALFLVLT